ncbi:MAG: ABC transporter ATP-binding protein [Cyclobacteriaceae bacterium]
MIDISIDKKLLSADGPMNLDLNLQIEQGKFVTLYGKSGAGKTSILRILSGLMSVDSGSISVNNEQWFDSAKNINLPPQKRNVGMVFQDYALFPHLTVRENLLFAKNKRDTDKFINELIEITDLGALQSRKPSTLSGGQQQRVALARALAQKPSILLLDEPMSALDREIRMHLQQHVIHLHNEFELTTILVSHDISEILKMSDEVVVIDNGKIERKGRPTEIFGHNTLSGKFQFTGEILAIEKEEIIFIITVLIGKDLVKIVADESEASVLAVGDKVIVASKAFNPVIRKI